ncbi:MAG: 4Fe-4S dicluster domain-containing protein [Solobacterium sp.]|nr:4Fe-4S dicluster domain-containing protein [Solobacterium sp.]
MKDHFKERSTRDYRQKRLFSKEELERRESLCVHEDPPFCNASCPLKLDVREMLKEASEGSFAKARSCLEHISPFPEILAYGCDAPCRKVCRRTELEEAVNIPAVERAVMRYSEAPKGKGLLKFKKKQKIAVFGTELFTLALAAEMAVKKYPVTLFTEAEDSVDLLKRCTDLPEEIMLRQIPVLEKTGIEIRFRETADRTFLEKEGKNYDIVCGASVLKKEAVDPVTLCDSAMHIFPSDQKEYGHVLQSFFDARRAAVSIERIVQKLDPHSTRPPEGKTESRLFTNLNYIPAEEAVIENGIYTEEECIREASRCIQCECAECMRGCAYLRAFRRYPRILTREIYNNTGIIMGDHMMNKALNACALCGQCTVTCPNGYDMADICRLARENMVETQKMSLAVHEFALLDMLFSNQEGFLSRPQPGFETCRYVYFPGCQAGGIAPKTVYKTYTDLINRLDGGVALMLGCCGVIAKWAGRKELYEEQTALLKQKMKELGDPVIIAGCPTCKVSLQEHFPDVTGLWDILKEISLPEGFRKYSGTVIVHDACGARSDPGTQDTIREIAEELGCTLQESTWSREKTGCCGYGGLVSYVNRDVASMMAEDCVKEDRDAVYLTYCMACRDRLTRQGVQAVHLTELVYNEKAEDTPGLSAKRRNRLLLKQSLLKDIWKEETMEKKLPFVMELSDEVRAKMEDRMILESDLIQTISAYRENGMAVYNESDDTLTASCRIGNVSFWIRFREKDDRYTVLSAYSHRMTVRIR